MDGGGRRRETAGGGQWWAAAGGGAGQAAMGKRASLPGGRAGENVQGNSAETAILCSVLFSRITFGTTFHVDELPGFHVVRCISAIFSHLQVLVSGKERGPFRSSLEATWTSTDHVGEISYLNVFPIHQLRSFRVMRNLIS